MLMCFVAYKYATKQIENAIHCGPSQIWSLVKKKNKRQVKRDQ